MTKEEEDNNAAEERAAAVKERATAVKERGIIRGRATKLLKRIEDEQNERDREVLVQLLRGVQEPLKIAHLKVQLLISDEERSDDEDLQLDGYNIPIARALRAPAEEAPCSVSTGKIHSIPGGSGMRFNVPPLDMKKFTGKAAEWRNWWGVYKCFVHDEEYSLARKMALLKTYVEGEAGKVIDSFPVDGGQYDAALRMLRQVYDHPEREAQQHWIDLLDVPGATSEEPEELRRVLTESERHLLALETLGELGGSGGGRFLPIFVMSKFPRSLRVKWEERKASTDKEDSLPRDDTSSTNSDSGTRLERMRCFLQDYVKASENAMVIGDGANRAHPGGARGLNASAVGALPGSVSEGYRKTPSTMRGQPQPCSFCDGEHWSSECSERLTPNEARRRVQERGGCYRCGHEGHMMRTCKWKGQCSKCNNRHATQLCRQEPRQEPRHEPRHEPNSVERAACAAVGNGVLMRTMCVVINGEKTRALTDSGCSRSFVLEERAKAERWQKVGEKKLLIEGFGGKREEGVYPIFKAKIEAGPVSQEVELIGVKQLAGDFSQVCPQRAEELKQIGFWPLADQQDGEVKPVQVILGDDALDYFLPGPTRKTGLPSGLKATWSFAGWVIHGGAEGSCKVSMLKVVVRDSLEAFWNLEHLGICEDLQDDGEMLIKESLKRDGAHYQVEWPMKAGLVPANNRNMAAARESRLKAKLTAEELVVYHQLVKQMTDDNYLEEVSPPLPEEKEGVTYLPHRPVFRAKAETTKVRMVVDPSSAPKGQWALNDCVLEGPTALPRVPGLLMRFRCGKVAVTADVQKAFLQIRLGVRSRDRCRILWDGKEYRFTAVPFGVKASPGILATVLQSHLHAETEFPKTAEKLRNAMYVDDWIHSEDQEPDVGPMVQEAKMIFEKAGMTLHKVKTGIDRHQVDSGVLGITWTQADNLRVQFPKMEPATTKRELAQLVGRIYDPMGVLSPALYEVRVLLQDEGQKGWDDELTQEGKLRLNVWVEEASETAVEIPRWIGSVSGQSVELHLFTDASIRVYAACVYVKLDGQVKLLMSKARLVSREMAAKGFSPRFELLGCVLGAKLISTVIAELSPGLNISRLVGWTDSSCCIKWIQGSQAKWDSFVRNRVQQITEVTGLVWRHVAGKENPADLPTRGVRPKDLPSTSAWFEGPVWLSGEEEDWPEQKDWEEPEQIDERVDALQTQIQGNDVLREMVEPSVSRWKILVRAVVRIQRRLRAGGEISLEEEKEAEKAIWRQVQRAHFPKGEAQESWLKSLNPFVDSEGILRMGGRLHNANLAEEVQHPVLLPQCGAVALFVQHVHEQSMHAGTSMIVSAIREKGVHILKGRRFVNKVWSRCRKCTRFRAGPGEEVTPPLPKDRVTFAAAFQTTGVDLAGPVFISGKKHWILVLTCMVVRAVHFELIGGLDVESTVRGLRRFAAVRGWPEKFMSDHGTNFTAASRKIPSKWEFMIEKGPWWGGTWERLIGVMKDLLRRTLGRSPVDSYENMLTELKQAEQIMNARPIAKGGSDKEGAAPALTPAQFLRPPGELNEERLLQWNTEMQEEWRSRYLVGVLGAAKAEIWNKTTHHVHKGDTVLLESEGKKRVLWPLGVVEKLLRGADGRARSARVRVKGGVLYRPVQKLYPLESRGKEMESDEDETESENEIGNPEVIEAKEGGSESDVEDQSAGAMGEQVVTTRVGRSVNKPKRLEEYV
jgi:hypothetical protein